MFYSHPEAISWCSDVFIASFCGRILELSGTAHRSVYYRTPDRQPQPGNTSLLDPFPHRDLNPSLPAQLLSAAAQTSQSVPSRQPLGSGAWSWSVLGCNWGRARRLGNSAVGGFESHRFTLEAAAGPCYSWGALPWSSALFALLIGEGIPMTLKRCKWKFTESAAIDTKARCPAPNRTFRTPGRWMFPSSRVKRTSEHPHSSLGETLLRDWHVRLGFRHQLTWGLMCPQTPTFRFWLNVTLREEALTPRVLPLWGKTVCK